MARYYFLTYTCPTCGNRSQVAGKVPWTCNICRSTVCPNCCEYIGLCKSCGGLLNDEEHARLRELHTKHGQSKVVGWATGCLCLGIPVIIIPTVMGEIVWEIVIMVLIALPLVILAITEGTSFPTRTEEKYLVSKIRERYQSRGNQSYYHPARTQAIDHCPDCNVEMKATPKTDKDSGRYLSQCTRCGKLFQYAEDGGDGID